MDGIRNLIGRREVTVAIGRPYRLTVRTLEEHAERENYILELKLDPGKLLERDDLSPTSMDAIASRDRLSRFVSLEDGSLFENSMHGLCFRFWQAVRFYHGTEIRCPEDAYQLLYRYGRGQLIDLHEKLLIVEEQDILGRLIFPAADGGNSREEGRPHKRRIAWAKIIRQLADKHNWTPDQIGSLTLYRAMVLLGAQCPEDIRRITFQSVRR